MENIQHSSSQSVSQPSLITQPSPIENPTSNSSKLPVILTSSLLFISLVGVGFFFYQTQSLKQQLALVTSTPQPTSLPTANPTTSPTDDPTANWQTYSNSKYNFSFKYPKDWKATLSPGAGDEFNLVVDKKSNTSEAGFVPVQFMTNAARDEQGNKTRLSSLTQAEVIYKISKTQSKKNIMIDNKPAVVVSGTVDSNGPGFGQFLQYTFVELDNDILVIQLGNKNYQTTFDQIVSTLKFND